MDRAALKRAKIIRLEAIRVHGRISPPVLSGRKGIWGVWETRKGRVRSQIRFKLCEEDAKAICGYLRDCLTDGQVAQEVDYVYSTHKPSPWR